MNTIRRHPALQLRSQCGAWMRLSGPLPLRFGGGDPPFIVLQSLSFLILVLIDIWFIMIHPLCCNFSVFYISFDSSSGCSVKALEKYWNGSVNWYFHVIQWGKYMVWTTVSIVTPFHAFCISHFHSAGMTQSPSIIWIYLPPICAWMVYLCSLMTSHIITSFSLRAFVEVRVGMEAGLVAWKPKPKPDGDRKPRPKPMPVASILKFRKPKPKPLASKTIIWEPKPKSVASRPEKWEAKAAGFGLRSRSRSQTRSWS